MLSDNTRRITIITLVILTAILGVAVVFIANQLQQTQAPEDSAASTASNVHPIRHECGTTCNSDADCVTHSSGGVAVACLGGKCSNTICHNNGGTTVTGANCECQKQNSCGQPCSGNLGLCDSNSQCGFIGNPAACNENENRQNGTQYCLPKTANQGYTLSSCTDAPQTRFLKKPDGTSATTQADVVASCTPIVVAQTVTCYRCTANTTDSNTCESFVFTGTSCPSGTSSTAGACAVATTGGVCTGCGDNICSTGETIESCPNDCRPVCGDNICSTGETIESCPNDCRPVCGDNICSSGETNATCPTDCKTAVLPDTAIISDSADRLILGIMAIILGILSLRFNLISRTFDYFGQMNFAFVLSDEYKDKVIKTHKKNEFKKIKRDRDSFEDKVLNKKKR